MAAAENPLRRHRSRSLPIAVDGGKPPQTPPLAGSLAESLDILLNRIISQPGSQPEAPIAPCVFEDSLWLCQNVSPGHLAFSPSHMRRVFAFLEARGVRRAAGLAQLYGALSVNLVAVALEFQEVQGVRWADGLDAPGAWLHTQVKRLSAGL